MYVCGLVIPVPEENMQAYRAWAESGAAFFKAYFEAAEERMHRDERMDSAGQPPFDAKRLILGCFEPLVSMGRE